MLRLLLFVGIGIGIGGAVVGLVGPPGAGAWAFPVAMVIIAATATLLLIARSVRGLHTPSAADIAEARAQGRTAIVRVDAIRQTGSQINDQPVCELELTVQPARGPAFRTTVRRIVRVIDVPRFQRGSTHSAVLLVDGGPEVAVVDDAEADVSPTVELPSVAEAGPIVTPDPATITSRGERRRPLLGTGRSGRPARTALFVLTAVVAAAAVISPYHVAVGQTIAALPDGRLHADLRHPENLVAALDAVVDEVGHDRIVSVTVTADLIVVEAPLRPGELATDTWYYRRGEVQHGGATTIQPRHVGEQFAIDDVSWGRLWPVASEASADAGLADTSTLTMRAGRGTDADVESETFGEQVGPVRVVFSASDDYRSVTFTVEPDGSGLSSDDTD